jgi:serine/threonine protein kinase
VSNYPVKFGKYLLLERINVGGMAEVFKGKNVGANRIVAIKRILPNLVEDDEFIRMFIDEARIAFQLAHPNIIEVYELSQCGEHYYIAMEYMPSRDLRAILDRLHASGQQLMPISQAAYITSLVADGLDFAHKRKDASDVAMNIVHRDVSPQNVLISYDGVVKVIDFGIAKAANRASKTQAGVLKGKFAYMSPEQVSGKPVDRRSDLFAVGVLLYEMLTGERLFVAENDYSTLERVRNAEVPPPTTYNKKISPELEAIVLKALAREVDDRYQWGSELVAALQPFLHDGKQEFSRQRLAQSMADLYPAEIALERTKHAEHARVSAPSPTNQNDDDAEGFGEDKTFVIEAAPQAMTRQPTHGRAGAMPSDEVSLYAGREHDAPTAMGGTIDKLMSASQQVARPALAADDDSEEGDIVAATAALVQPSGSQRRDFAVSSGPETFMDPLGDAPDNPTQAMIAATAGRRPAPSPTSFPPSKPSSPSVAAPRTPLPAVSARRRPSPAPKSSGVSLPGVAVLGAMCAVAAVAAIGSAAFMMTRMGRNDVELHAAGAVAVPADVKVMIGDRVVASQLPATIALPTGATTIVIRGTGVQEIVRTVTTTGGVQHQPVMFQPAGAGWRLSLAAIDGAGAPLRAQAFVNGEGVGETPLEVQVDKPTAMVRLHADGFADFEKTMSGAGKSVGPATVAMKATGQPIDTVETKPTETKPTETKPTETKPTETKPTETKPTETKPTETKPTETKPTEAKPVDPKKPTETKPTETKPTETKPDAKALVQVQLGTLPYAMTKIDGVKRGSTPFFGKNSLMLSLGKHRIEFVDTGGKKHRYELTIKAADPNNKVVIHFDRVDPPRAEGQLVLKKLD